GDREGDELNGQDHLQRVEDGRRHARPAEHALPGIEGHPRSTARLADEHAVQQDRAGRVEHYEGEDGQQRYQEQGTALDARQRKPGGDRAAERAHGRPASSATRCSRLTWSGQSVMWAAGSWSAIAWPSCQRCGRGKSITIVSVPMRIWLS